MWRSIFLHEFLDQRIDSFQAAPGQATPASLALAPAPDPALGTTSVAVRPSVGFEYALTTPLQNVAGVSCRVRMRYPINLQQWQFSIIKVGDAAELLLKTSTPTPDQSGTITSPAAYIGASFFSFKSVVIPANKFTELRLDWHASGQARLLLDDQLVAYRNGVAVGQAFSIDRVTFGMPHDPSAAAPTFPIARVFVRALIQEDPLRQLSDMLPEIDAGDPSLERCRRITMMNLLAVVSRLREFMAEFHAVTSVAWSKQDGPATGPFQTEARKAHEWAMQAMVELRSMLRTADFSEPKRFLDPFSSFLQTLHDVLPTQFKTLADELSQVAVVPKDCQDELASVAKNNHEVLLPIGELLTAAAERIKEIAEGN